MTPSRGMVVSAHRLASEAGAAVLRRGGNAFDAAVATSLMLGVVEPAFSGIGGGGFAIFHTSSGEDHALDYREVAPLESSASMFADGSDTNRVGPLAVATPGLLAGHSRILEEYGTMKFRDVASPAIKAAKSGIPVDRLSRDVILDGRTGVANKLRRFRASAEVFLGKDKFPILAKTLTRLAEEGPQDFYRGSIPGEAAGHLRNLGGILSEEDFERYGPKERKPIKGEHRECELVSMPPPSAGGTLLVRGLRIFEELEGGQDSRREPARLSATAAILRSVLAEKWIFGDPEFTDVPVAALLSGANARRKAGEIRSGGAELSHVPSLDIGSTSHFCVADTLGNAVAVTETIECYYGSGVTVPSLGVVLNDEMHDFDVASGRPNSVAPLKRPASNMSPTIVLNDGSPFLILGGAGSERIISSVFQVVTNVLDRGMTLTDAIAEPRVHPGVEGLVVEGGFRRATVAELRHLGVRLKVRTKRDFYFGGVQAIMVDPDSGSVSGAADPRRRGVAVSA